MHDDVAPEAPAAVQQPARGGDLIGMMLSIIITSFEGQLVLGSSCGRQMSKRSILRPSVAKAVWESAKAGILSCRMLGVK